MSETDGRIDARLPLALLCAVQEQDTPPELLPDENPHAFFPNRLGLSGVIDVQIRQFKRLARLRRRIDLAEVEALLELVSRRSDASDVFTDAGRRLAGFHFAGLVGTFRRLNRRLPRRLRRRAAIRALRKAHDAFLVAADLSVRDNPIEFQATDVVTARVGDYVGACRMYGSLTARLLELSGLGTVHVSHVECQRHGAERCLWVVEEDR